MSLSRPALAAALDDLLLVHAIGGRGTELLVARVVDRLTALAGLELQDERVGDALELGHGVVVEDVRVAQRVEDRRVAAQVIEQLVSKTWGEELRRLLATLTPMEARILRWRFGLDEEDELTLKEIGDKYNLSRERIRQLQEQALGKIRRQIREYA